MEKMENQVPLRNDKPELEARGEKRGSNDPALLKGALLKGVLSTWSYSPSKWIESPWQESCHQDPGSHTGVGLASLLILSSIKRTPASETFLFYKNKTKKDHQKSYLLLKNQNPNITSSHI